LASDDFKACRAAATELQSAIPEERLEEAIGALNIMREAEDLAAARQPFKVVSDTLIKTFRQHTPATESGLYLAYCPMAYDSTGAYWVQDDRIVNNPYFGSMMLRCGIIRETLAESSSNDEQPHGDHNH
jgi:Cu(I)/Ag(I) efflux system membrane fusion protein